MLAYAAAAGGFCSLPCGAPGAGRGRRGRPGPGAAGGAASWPRCATRSTRISCLNTLHSILALVRCDPVRAEEALFAQREMLRYLLDTERSGDDQVLLRATS
jgi:hypothetical protein